MPGLNSKIVWNIKRVCSERGISQSDLARLLSKKASQISVIFAEKHALSMGQAEEIASKLGVPFEELLSAPPAKEAPPREPTALEMLSFVVSGANVHPERKTLVLGLLKDPYLPQEKADAVKAILGSKNKLTEESLEALNLLLNDPDFLDDIQPILSGRSSRAPLKKNKPSSG